MPEYPAEWTEQSYAAHAEKDAAIVGLREALTSAYSMLSLMRYRSSASFDGSVGLPDVREADAVLSKCRAALGMR